MAQRTPIQIKGTDLLWVGCGALLGAGLLFYFCIWRSLQ